ncbi:poly-beta-1,6 N-acetyl-D-glucosamine export porin PgaA [Pigmentiphaga aceris]|uniref:poly-beta-1,6 N-acetyl-D-glucosamine export porin PgaA n=1 Tax=Pigmentiphaga aceris TaxID=1940612 RepID=UPI00165229A5|nr:poly-beta-1,6 N-acetyl-D-glucosamine export porin PgaA [Pigmentiphaga aceris]
MPTRSPPTGARSLRAYPTLRQLIAAALVAQAGLAIPLAGNAQSADTAGAPRAATASPYDATRHDALVGAVRDGSTSPSQAVDQLNAWAAQPLAPAVRQRVRADTIVFAMRAGDAASAVRYARADGGIAGLPDYALEFVFQAARSIPDHALQGEAVAQLRSRQPEAWRPRVLEALWLTDTGEFDRAETVLNVLAARSAGSDLEQRVALLEARGALNEARERPLEALGNYTDLNAIDPGHRYARREGTFLLGQVDAPTAAWKEAQAASPDMFTPLERASMQQQALGRSLRWAIAERDQAVGHGPARFVRMDEVLAGFEPAIQEANTAEAQARAAADEESARAWRDLSLQLRYDRMLAWLERGRFPAVIAEYEALRADGVNPPYYALSAAAGAYQQQRRSDLAVPLYEAALRDGGSAIPTPSDTHVGLVYAYLDTAQFEQADALLTQLETATPPLLRRSPERGRANPQYGAVRNLRALEQLYTDRPAVAERSFGILSGLAPMHSGFRDGQAQTQRLREHPDAALALYEELLTDSPDDVSVRAGYATALMDANQHRAGRELTDALEQEAPESIAVRNAVRMRDGRQAARLDIEAGASWGGGALSNRDWRTDTTLSSPLIDDQWRVFYHQIFAQADVDQGSSRLARSGLGLQWTEGRWGASGEIHHANQGPYRTGLALGLNYRASDAWRFAAEIDTNSPETPWRARRADIGAHSAAAAATYVVNESRSFTGRVQRMDYSDGNQRDAVGLSWRERLITGPRFQLESTLGAEVAGADRQDVPYFSPSRERAVELGLRAQYLTWKRDDRRFYQVVQAGTGRYNQAGFGSGALWSVRYQHQWDIGDALQLSYGLGISSHPYDGRSERSREVFLTISVPLQ